MNKARLVLLASGDGSIAQSIIDAVKSGELDAQIVGLICDQPEANVIARATGADIESFLIPMQPDRRSWDREIFDKLN